MDIVFVLLSFARTSWQAAYYNIFRLTTHSVFSIFSSFAF